MAKKCVHCGFIPAPVEAEPPPKPTAGLIEEQDPEKCPNCGKSNAFEEIVLRENTEEEEE
jgi:hypothetical protein